MSILMKRLSVWVGGHCGGRLGAAGCTRLGSAAGRQAVPAARRRPPPTLGLENGTLDFDTPDFTLKLVKDSQTIAALQPKGAKGMDANTPFDFTPADQLTARQGDRFNHLGDIQLRIQQAGWREGAWVDLASSHARKPVTPCRRAMPAVEGARVLTHADDAGRDVS